MRTQLVMVAGLLGSGNRDLAEMIARRERYALFSISATADTVLPPRLRDAKPSSEDLYTMVMRLTQMQLALGISVVVVGSFPTHSIRSRFSELARTHDAEFVPIYTHCSDEALWKQRLLMRLENAKPDDTFTGWYEVQRQRANYAAWDEAHTLIYDSAYSFDENYEALAKFLKSEVHRPYITPDKEPDTND